MTSAGAAPRAPRSRTVATWLALVGGSLGLHRFYLHGARDVWAWLYPWPTLAGAYGFWRLREIGLDDTRGALLVPLLGAMVAAAMLQAIVYGLTSDARWAERHGGMPGPARSAWPTVIAVVLALAIGAAVTMATIAFAAQRYFELRGELR
jgi:hypothetical protein